MDEKLTLASIDEVGALGVCHLKRFWSKSMLRRMGKGQDIPNEFFRDRLLIDALYLGMTNTMEYIYQEAPDFETFEKWVVKIGREPSSETIDRVNADLLNMPSSKYADILAEEIEKMDSVFSEEELIFWEKNGYIVLKNAVSKDACRLAQNAVWDFINASPKDEESWYTGERRKGIMVELVQHEALDANRNSKRIHKAFSQLWKTADLWVSADRCGFNPPQTDKHSYGGPPMHWDVDFSLPNYFWTQGILYLSDTLPNQGALTLVPGFHHRYEKWMNDLPKGIDPQKEDLHALGSIPIEGEAGDLIIWRHELPHSSSPNLTHMPRIVQYINYYNGRQPY